LLACAEIFGLPSQSPDEDDPMSSKRSYVKRRQLAAPRDDVILLARKIHEEFPTDELAALNLGEFRRGTAESQLL
jgi:hypothetical protein